MANERIGRLRFFFYVLIIVFIFLIPLKVAFEAENGFFIMGLFFLQGIFMGLTMEKRAKDIGVDWKKDSMAKIWLVISMGAGICAINPSLESATGLLLIQFISIPIILLLLFLPSKEKISLLKERRMLVKTKKDLLKQRKRIIDEQEVEKLKAEIAILKVGDK